ncbi:MAG: hypothetical protein OEW48_09760 [Phycisphaerae bacterium]|nr:hypothetical protein [Phycisphaerae bacterium]
MEGINGPGFLARPFFVCIFSVLRIKITEIHTSQQLCYGEWKGLKNLFGAVRTFCARPCVFSLVLLLQQLTIDDFCIWAVAARPHIRLVSYAPAGRRVELIGKTAKFATDLTSGVRNDYKDTVDNTMWILNQLADGREF